MKIKFTGGILDGWEEEVAEGSGWDFIRVAGVANPAGKIIQEYRWAGAELTPTGSRTAMLTTLRFEVTQNVSIEPGESARVLRLRTDV